MKQEKTNNVLMGAVTKNQPKKLKRLIFASVLIGLIVGCSNQKYSQCQSIIAIANEANQKATKITEVSLEKELKITNWLQASDIMAAAAQKLENLTTKDLELLDYQKSLATVFKIYSQAIYDAVQARESKNLPALKIAREDAQKAGQLNKTLVKEINSYCSRE